MTLAAYTNLIRYLPYLDQAFETKKANWQRECRNNITFKTHCDKVFQTKDVIKLSREDCFKYTTQNFDEALYSIIFWGYPRNMRGNSFSNILQSLPTIKQVLSCQRDLTSENFKVLYQDIKGTGLGLSTLTKVLYFFRFTINSKPCLILDQRIIDVLQSELFIEFKQLSKINDHNKVSNYATYLEIMQNLALQNDYTPDQLEFFLFHFGKNLKPADG